MTYSQTHLEEICSVVRSLDASSLESMVDLLQALRQRQGRLFILGVGGSAANASHAVNDFRKICGVEAYAPTDNISEITARTNDEGWPSTFVEWLKVSQLSEKDCVMVFSVGGGSLETNVSPNIVRALQFAKSIGARILGIVGRDGGFTAQVADRFIIIPTVNEANATPHTEAIQAVIWHLFVSHPKLKVTMTKWESVR